MSRHRLARARHEWMPHERRQAVWAALAAACCAAYLVIAGMWVGAAVGLVPWDWAQAYVWVALGSVVLVAIGAAAWWSWQVLSDRMVLRRQRHAGRTS